MPHARGADYDRDGPAGKYTILILFINPVFSPKTSRSLESTANSQFRCLCRRQEVTCPPHQKRSGTMTRFEPYALRCATPGCLRQVRPTILYCCDECARKEGHAQSCEERSRDTHESHTWKIAEIRAEDADHT